MAVQTASNTRTTSRAARPRRAASAPTPIDQDQRRALIAQAAYFRAERRGFAPGYEAEDWLAAETEVDTAMTLGAVNSSG